MDRILITQGDFLKNAGIVGLKYMLKLAGAKENVDYEIEGQNLWLERTFVETADWTDMYFHAFVEYFGPLTAYQRVMEKIDSCLEKIEKNIWMNNKEEKEDLAYINDKLLSNSYQAGYANIEIYIQNAQVYKNLKKSKLNVKISQEELQERLQELKKFLEQPLCRETFIMKSVIYTFINRFWDGKCFLLRANAKKDMRELFEEDFTKPLKKYLQSSHEKAKDLCIDCGSPMGNSEKVSIAFMKDMADDLTRKRSAFWNCKVDAFLCPMCAFVYAASPLGFQTYANKFVFINTNESIQALLVANRKMSKSQIEAEKEENETYSAWFARLMDTVLGEKTKELSNVQVILRGVRAEDQYMFSIIQREIVEILSDKMVKNGLEKLGVHPYIKMRNELMNVHETVILNILQYRDQYTLLNQLLKASIENPSVLSPVYWVYTVQLGTSITRRKEKNKERGIFMNRRKMQENGYKLRTELLKIKKTDTDECLRGTIYQLLNALAVGNQEKFMDIVIRLYGSCRGLLMPDGFVYMLGDKEADKERFREYGYAFLLGFKGSYSDNNINVKEDTSEEDGKWKEMVLQ
nr:Cas8a1 family CRISPR/Cas system-associated protein [uncultured Sellimonas sp.]